jgi:hypothetical protein
MSLISTPQLFAPRLNHGVGLQRQVLTPITVLTPKAPVLGFDEVTMPELLACVANARRSYNRNIFVSATRMRRVLR